MIVGDISIRRNYQKLIWHACEKCGKERWVQLVKGQPKAKLCKVCVHSRKISRICLNCHKQFLAKRCWLKSGRGKFCSVSCGAIYYRKRGLFRKSPNRPEQMLIETFNQNSLPFRYVGNGEVWLGNHNPDFINTDGKKQVIEFLGAYWHPLFDGASRTEHYKQYGFDCLVIWEDELIDIPKLIAKLKRFESKQCAIAPAMLKE